MIWKIGRAWAFYQDDGPDWAARGLGDLVTRAAAGEPVAEPLASLTTRLGKGAYPDLIESAVADARQLENQFR